MTSMLRFLNSEAGSAIGYGLILATVAVVFLAHLEPLP